MGIPIENQKLLYHITAINNIESILRDGLLSRANVQNFVDVAEQDIIDFRTQTGISHTIPFHFFLGTPFAGVVQVNHPTQEFVYITIHRNIAKENKFKIFPTHPKHMKPLQAYDYEEGMNKLIGS